MVLVDAEKECDGIRCTEEECCELGKEWPPVFQFHVGFLPPPSSRRLVHGRAKEDESAIRNMSYCWVGLSAGLSGADGHARWLYTS